MHVEKRKSLAQKLLMILNSVREGTKDATKVHDAEEIRNGFDMSFVDDPPFIALTDFILKERAYQQKFSKKFIREKLIEAAYAIAEDGNIREEAVRAGVDALDALLENYSDLAEVYIPLVGVKLELPKLELGNITLVNMDETRLAMIKRHLLDSVSFSKVLPEEREKLIENYISDFRRDMLGLACARIEVLGDMDKAIEIAEKECNRSVDLLRYALPFLYSRTVPMYVGMQGWLAHGSRTSTVLVKGSSGWVGGSWSSKGPRVNLDLNRKAFCEMVSTRVFELAEIVKSANPTLFEQILLTAVHWFASSQTELDRQYQFLSMIICLETLFSPESGEPITKSIAEGAAIISGTDLEMRKRSKNRMLELYGVRSGISHRGKIDISDRDLDDLQGITMAVLRNLIARRTEFESQGALTKWVDEQKLSYVASTTAVPQLLPLEAQRAAYFRYVEPAPAMAPLAAATTIN
jgi:hypothetical protein